MWFKNLQIYRFPAPWNTTVAQLEEALARHPFRSCTSYELQTQGWASPRENGALVHAVNGHWLLALGTEKKLLPASVIKELVKVRAVDMEQRQGFKPGRKQLRELKDQTTDELLPRAFNVRRNTLVWIDPVHGRLVIDAGSPGRADEVVAHFNKAITDISLERLNVAMSPGAAMTSWLAANETPHGFSIDQDTELQSPADEKATVRFVRHALDPKEVQRHIAGGKQCTRLALTWANRVSFVLTESFTLKKISLVDIIKEGLDSGASIRDEDEQLDADFAMMTGELKQLLEDLVEALGGVQTVGGR